MKNLYIITLLTLITFILYITRNTKEYFTQIKNKKTIILLGDSVFNNNSYVEKGKAVNELLQKTADETTTIVCLARNDSTINNVYQQLENVTIDLNDKLTTVFLSVGGNDIINLKQKNVEDIIQKLDGNYMVIGETWRKSNSADNTGTGAIRKLGGFGGGSTSTTDSKDKGFTLMDFAFFNFDATGELSSIDKIEKTMCFFIFFNFIEQN